MELKLIETNVLVKDYIDYTQGVLNRRYIEDGAQYYFTLHQEMARDGIVTGRWLAVLLSPYGMHSFFLVRNEANDLTREEDPDGEKLTNPEQFAPYIDLMNKALHQYVDTAVSAKNWE